MPYLNFGARFPHNPEHIHAYSTGYASFVGTLANISGKEAVRAFARAGWRTASQVGSHLVMTKTGVPANLCIPQHKELSVGTLRALIRNSGLTVDEFLALL